MIKQNKFLAFKIPEKMKEELGKCADKEDRPVSSIVRIAIKNFLQERKKNAPTINA